MPPNASSMTDAPWERDYDVLFKLLLVGDSAVGKTATVSSYCGEPFDSNSISTIGVDFKVKTFELEGKRVKLQIWDTAGQDRFRSVTQSYYRGAQGIALCYDSTRPETVSNLRDFWLPEVSKYARPDANLLLLGTKADLSEQPKFAEARREAAARADALLDHGDADFRLRHQHVVTSAKTGENIDEAVVTIVREMLAAQPRLAAAEAARAGRPLHGRALRQSGERDAGGGLSSCAC